MMSRSLGLGWRNRGVVIGAIALLTVILLTVFAAPSNLDNSGSSYSRAPDGYGAWYAFLQQQGVTVQRWRKPYRELPAEWERNNPNRTPITLIQASANHGFLGYETFEENWLRQGNRLVRLGEGAPSTRARFSTTHATLVGTIKIDTRRRGDIAGEEEQVLGDRFGAIVWRTRIGKGEILSIPTPYLAANAYQNEPGNFAYLAQLIGTGGAVWFDEYLHGYDDTPADTAAEPSTQLGWEGYLANTPLLPILFQGGIVLVTLIWALNQRFGRPQPLLAPTIDNSRAYIEALAGVLQKAESSEFVVEVVGKEEQLRLQKALGLGTILLDADTLSAAWVQTGRSVGELEAVFRPYWQNAACQSQS